MAMEFRNVFITVGTTSFDELIAEVNARAVAALKQLGCKRLVVQYGRGESAPTMDQELFEGIDLEMYGLRSSITPDIQAADLVIGHAGAGTCLEVLKAGKPLIIVINDTLMDNHQTELSRSLTSQGIVASCFVPDLTKTLLTFNPQKLKKLMPGHPELFQEQLDRLLGYFPV